MQEQVVIVTGASRGIGQATAAAMAQAGARVVAVARSLERLDQTQRLIKDAGGRGQALAADVKRYAEMQGLIESTVKEHGRVDVLVNNAGSAPLGKMDSHDVAAFDDMMSVNCNAVFYGCRAVWPIMMRQGGGTIVNISSVAAKDPFPGFAAYGASKRWVNAMTEALAAEGREHNIRVYAVAPGAVETTMLRQHFPDFPAEQCLRPDEIAQTIAWILDPRSQHASGAIVYVTR